ncbi:MAG: acyl-CoA dehydrogenase [Hyphomicrobiales bacterium]|nr:acyl-CoA dehydrogenase [Hyphomicrobiales bacterium]MBV8439216.1 acyl-CoA dehydrogenase [Hyphomicrobiales bacterium]
MAAAHAFATVPLTPLGAEPELADTAAAVQETARRYAQDVMRPVGLALDRMTPDEAIAAGSPLWDALKQFGALGFTVDALLAFEPAERARIMCILFEELGWGDSGLAVAIGAGMLPALMSTVLGNAFCRAIASDDKLGCWAITEPDHGTDMLDPSRMIFHPQGNYGRPNCVVTIKDDELVINGQKSAWVSNGVIGQVCILYAAADTGSGPSPQQGAVVIVPGDAKGVSRGKPLDKMGQRALNQGEIFFDDVRLSKEHLLAGPDQYQAAVYAVHCFANALMGAIFTGCARSAYDLAHGYVHERKAGGVAIIRHQSVAHRLFHMFRKVEASCALARRVAHYNFTAPQPALQAAMTAKVTATQTAFEVASDALQIFGGNGLTRAYPIEKILRDARASLIEDGCNEILAIKGGYYLADPDRL